MEPIILNQDLYVPIDFLKKNYNIKVNSIYNGVNKYRKGFSRFYENIINPYDKRAVMIKFKTIPAQLIRKYQIPNEEIIIKKIDEMKLSDTYSKLKIWLDFAYEHDYKNYQKYYVGNFFDLDLIISYSRTHCLFHTIININNNSKSNQIKIKDLFLIYQTYSSLQFETNNLKSFYNKLNEFKTDGYTVFINKNYKKMKNGKKLTEFHINTIKDLFKDKRQLNNREIHKELNIRAVLKGFREVSISTVNNVISDPVIQNECQPYRNGKEWMVRNFNPFKYRNEIKNNGELWQLDGSRFQIAYRNSEGERSFLWFFVVMDVHSRKIVGFSQGNSENHKVVIDALRNAVKNTNYVPKELLIDNGRCYTHKEFKKLEYRFNILGCYVRRHLPNSPRDKGQVERFFSTFQTTICKNEIGYVGEGIKSKRKEGRPSNERLSIELNPSNLKSKEELIKHLGTLIEKYNNLRLNDKVLAPETRYNSAKIDCAYKISENDYAILFWDKRYEYTIQNSMIILGEGTHNKELYSYTIESTELRYRLNLTTVIVCFLKNNRSLIKVFDQNESFITDLYLDDKIDQIQKKMIDVEESKEKLKTLINTKDKLASRPKSEKINSNNQIYKSDSEFEILLIKNKGDE